MGMFDEIKVDYILPEHNNITPEIGAVYQTKDLDCLLDKYVLTDEGVLVRSYWDKTTQTLMPFGSNEEMAVFYHGCINIYNNTDRDGWIEYKLKFTDGKLVEVTPVII